MLDLAGTSNDLTLGFSYNPAAQILSNSRSNGAYSYTKHTSGTIGETPNGLNQLVNRGGAAIGYDAKGNVTYDPVTGYSFGYSSENLLTTVFGPSWTGTLRYDPLMRLYEAGAGPATRTVYDGTERIAEYSSSGAQTGRYVHGPGIDEPLVSYGGTGLASRSYQHADERGSIVALSDDAGTTTRVFAYDEYGNIMPGRNRFEYTGHVYESVSGLLYARARFYNPAIGRFMQADPLGYDDGMNMYARTKGDPVNFVDPWGLEGETYPIFGDRPALSNLAAALGGSSSGSYSGWFGGGFSGGGAGGFDGGGAENPEIVVFAQRPTRPVARVPRIGPRGLQYHEGAGHTIRFHVGRSLEQLRTRIAGEQLKQASSFSDLPTADAALRQAVKQNQSAIRAWLASGHGERFAIKLNAPIPLGLVLERGAASSRSSSTAVFWLGRNSDPFFSADFVVITGYLK